MYSNGHPSDRHHVSLFANKVLQDHLKYVQFNLQTTKNFLNAYSNYPSINSTQSGDDNMFNDSFCSKTQPKFEKKKEKVSKIVLKKGLLASKQNMLDNIFRQEKLTTRNIPTTNNNLLQSSKYSSKSVDIIKSVNQKMNFMKKSINYIFPRIYDLKQRERSKNIVQLEKTYLEGKLKKEKEFRRKFKLKNEIKIDFSECITISNAKFNLYK